MIYGTRSFIPVHHTHHTTRYLLIEISLFLFSLIAPHLLVREPIPLAARHIRDRDIPSPAQRNQLLVQVVHMHIIVMLQRDNPLLPSGRHILVQTLLKLDQDLLLSDHVRQHPVISPEIIPTPVHSNVPQLLEHEADTVINVTVGRAHVLEPAAGELVDELLGPLHLGHDLLVRESGQALVGPSVGGQVVTFGKLTADSVGPLNNVAANEEEGGLEALGLEVVENGRGDQVRAVVKSDGPGVVGAAPEQVVGIALVTEPVATIGE